MLDGTPQGYGGYSEPVLEIGSVAMPSGWLGDGSVEQARTRPRLLW